MKAIGDNLIITPMQQGVEKTKGGLLLTHSQREDIRFEKAKVLTQGEDVKGINEGDEIYFDSRAGHKIEINKDALFWWELFACIKGLAIWISAGHEFSTGSNTDPVNLFSAWVPCDIHLEIILDKLESLV